jgi:hypothetical protein
MRTLPLLVIALLSLSACAETAGPGSQAHLGTYELRMVNDGPLPYTLYDDWDATIELTAGRIVLEGPDLFTIEMTTRLHLEGDVSTETGGSTGSYFLEGGGVRFFYPNGQGFEATLQAQTLTVEMPASPGIDAATLVFVR